LFFLHRLNSFHKTRYVFYILTTEKRNLRIFQFQNLWYITRNTNSHPISSFDYGTCFQESNYFRNT
jgi:hypothetical protein